MRESNFSFPQQNRACLCITSQLYDRRALDTNSPLPLFNSLTHLTYLTSTSPRIREILTSDGGLERLVRLLRDFCMRPPPPESPTFFYGLTPPGSSYHALMTKQSPGQFDQAAAYRFSLAFQCIVNIGVRGSEAIRSRVVQAGTLDAVGCILETWLRSRGFVTYPCGSASGMVRERETREERALRREQKLREAHELAARYTAHQPQFITVRQLPASERATDIMSDSEMHETEMHDAESTDTSADHTPHRSNSPATSPIQSPRTRVRSETITPRRVDNANGIAHAANALSVSTVTARRRSSRSSRRSHVNTPTSGDAGPSNASTRSTGHEVNPASGSASDASPSRSPSPGLAENTTLPNGRGIITHAVGIVDTDPTSPTTFAQHGPMDINLIDADMVMNMREGLGLGALDVNTANDDLAMGAPPGAPGATVDIAAPVPDPVPDSGTSTPLPPEMAEDGASSGNVGPMSTPRTSIEATPRAASTDLPTVTGGNTQNRYRTGPESRQAHTGQQEAPIVRPAAPGPTSPNQQVARTITVGTMGRRRSFYIQDTTPYREEDVLLSLQLLAYLSKYPHVRQAFYQPRNVLGTGDSIIKTAGTYPCQSSSSGARSGKDKDKDHTSNSFLKALGVGGRGGGSKEKEREKDLEPPSTPLPAIGHHAPNVFSLVERFTFRPHPSELGLPVPPFHLPSEIQYWAGVIMRNACRKDDSRGGIRQCANMICGKWERFPREFAKCRRCRKARYCGKECQSKAWSDGHRFWCSVKESVPSGGVAERAGADDAASVVTARPADRVRTAMTRNGLGGVTTTNRQVNQATDAMDDGPGPLPPGTMAFTTPTTGTHTVVVRVRPDGTILNRRQENNRQQRHQPPPDNSILNEAIVVGTLANQDVDMSFSPTNTPANDIFSRDVDPDTFVRPIPRRRPTQGPTASTSRTQHATRVTPQPMDEDVEMAS